MTRSDAPANVQSLERRIRELEGDQGLALRRRTTMALVVVGQMLPGGAIKGGSAMAVRYGQGTRFTQDLDAARAQPLAEFRTDFETALESGWAGFTARLVQKPQPRPPAVPVQYVMQPFEVKLSYLGKSWCTIPFELGHNEIGDAEEPELRIADDLVQMFVDIGLEAPEPVPVMRADHQIAQKLHAASGAGSERARDLVDLQLLDRGEDVELGQVLATCARLFDYRKQQAWPPSIVVGENWDTLYAEAAEGCDVLPSVDEAVAWTNEFVARIASASTAEL